MLPGFSTVVVFATSGGIVGGVEPLLPMLSLLGGPEGNMETLAMMGVSPSTRIPARSGTLLADIPSFTPVAYSCSTDIG